MDRAERLIARARRLLDNWEDESEITRALGLFRQATELAPANPAGWMGLGDALRESEEDQEALLAYHQAMRLGRDDVTLWRGLAAAAAHVPGHAEESVEAIERARSYAPDNVSVLTEYVGILTTAGFPVHTDWLDKALHAVNRLLALTRPEVWNGDLAEALVGRAGLLLQLGRTGEALEAFEVLQSRVRYEQTQAEWLATYALGMAAYGRALALERLGRYNEALEAVSEGLSLEYNSAPFWRAFRGDLLVHVRQPEEGLIAVEEALKDSADFAYPWRVYARALMAVGRVDEAGEAERKASTLPEGPTLIEFLLPKV